MVNLAHQLHKINTGTIPEVHRGSFCHLFARRQPVRLGERSIHVHKNLQKEKKGPEMMEWVQRASWCTGR